MGRAVRPPALWLASLLLYYSHVGGGLGEAWVTGPALQRGTGVLMVLGGIVWYSQTLAWSKGRQPAAVPHSRGGDAGTGTPQDPHVELTRAVQEAHTSEVHTSEVHMDEGML